MCFRLIIRIRQGGNERSKTCIRLDLMHMQLSDKQIDINKKEILRLLISTQREGVERVIDYMYSSGFFKIPSSIDRHHCWKGGLAEHSLNVCKIALSRGEGSLPKDSIIVCSLLHDICKVGQLCYDEMGNLRRRETYIKGHGKRSVKLLEMLNFNLNEDERRAIRWHMGGYHAKAEDMFDLEMAKKSKLWSLVHKSDLEDATGKYNK